MIEAKVIIVGGGPAGSSCAWKLRQMGVDTLILDKKEFPRNKLCAGWVTPKVFKLLETTAEAYPHTKVLHRWYYYHYKGFCLPVRTRQYVIRRHEFDDWLLRRSETKIEHHKVQQVREDNGYFIIDDKYRCEYLVGAGGTNCPVYNQLFKPISPRDDNRQFSTLEEEFDYQYTNSRALFWYLDNNLSGYSWYTPKSDNRLTIGIGGYLSQMKARQENIRDHWNMFIEKLKRLSLVPPDMKFKPKGWSYYARSADQVYQIGNAYIVGDAAGMATVEMGEGIRPAVHSGILVARSITEGQPYTAEPIGRYSFKDILFPGK